MAAVCALRAFATTFEHLAMSREVLASHGLFQGGSVRPYRAWTTDILDDVHIEEFVDVSPQTKPLHDIAIAGR